MAVTVPRRTGFAPWAGLVAGMVGVAVQHQGISDALHFRCTAQAGDADLVVGVVVLVAIASGALVSWRALAKASPDESTRRFVARLSLMGAALFGVMVLWQTLAGSIVPACHA